MPTAGALVVFGMPAGWSGTLCLASSLKSAQTLFDGYVWRAYNPAEVPVRPLLNAPPRELDGSAALRERICLVPLGLRCGTLQVPLGSFFFCVCLLQPPESGNIGHCPTRIGEGCQKLRLRSPRLHQHRSWARRRHGRLRRQSPHLPSDIV